MITPIAWFTRTFTFDLPLGAFPSVVERLRGTPVRATELVSGVSDRLLVYRPSGKWSAKQDIGHLADLDDLDEKRLHDFLAGASTLSVADLTNRATETADHNQLPISVLLERLSVGRRELVRKLDALSEADVGRTALHPRLKQPMRLLDWAVFVADHDDHHLVHTRRAIADAGLSAVEASKSRSSA